MDVEHQEHSEHQAENSSVALPPKRCPMWHSFAFDESRACSWPHLCMQSESYRTVQRSCLKANHGSGFNGAVRGAGQHGMGFCWLWILSCSMESLLLH